jgi:hypothetical protein
MINSNSNKHNKHNKCYSCNIPISYYNDLCNGCKYNPDIVISLSEAKNKYKLTNEQIDDADLFNIQFDMYGTIGTKFLRKDIHELAKTICFNYNNNNNNNKMKLAFYKQQMVFDEIITNSKNTADKKKLIIYNLEANIMKLDYSYKIDDHPDILDYIDKYANDPEYTPFVSSNLILKKIIKHLEKITQIDKLIDSQNWDIKYSSIAKSCSLYRNFINNRSVKSVETEENNLNNIFNIIKSDIERQINYDKNIVFRTQQINDKLALLLKPNNKTDFVKATNHVLYNQYIYTRINNINSINLDTVANTIYSDIICKKMQSSRKTKLNIWIKKNINNKSIISHIQTHYLYTSFIQQEKEKEDIKDVKQAILKHVDNIKIIYDKFTNHEILPITTKKHQKQFEKIMSEYLDNSCNLDNTCRLLLVNKFIKKK